MRLKGKTQVNQKQMLKHTGAVVLKELFRFVLIAFIVLTLAYIAHGAWKEMTTPCGNCVKCLQDDVQSKLEKAGKTQ